MQELRLRETTNTMNRLLFCFLIFGSFGIANGQSIELGGGLNRNIFYNLGSDDGYIRTEYNSGYGYSLFLNLDDTLFTNYFAKLLITFDNFNGKIYATSGGLGGSSTTNADVNEKTIGLSYFLFKWKVKKAGWVSFGPALNFLLSKKMIGYHSSFLVNGGGGGIDTLGKKSTHYINDITFGLTARAAYDIRISNSWFIVPQIFIYIGLSNDFQNIEAEVNSFRQTIAIGIKKQFIK